MPVTDAQHKAVIACRFCPKPATIDGKTRYLGTWAYLCNSCYKVHKALKHPKWRPIKEQ